MSRVQPAKQRGPQSADVKETGRTGSKSGADGHELDLRKLRGAEFSRGPEGNADRLDPAMPFVLANRGCHTSPLTLRAVSSAVEHCFHTAGVTGSIPVPPTINQRLSRD